MFEAKVIYGFKCKLTKKTFKAGDIYRHPSEERMIELASLRIPRIQWPPLTAEERPDDAEPGEQIDGQGLPPIAEASGPEAKEPEAPTPEKPLEELTYQELQEKAKQKGIKANQRREQLIAALKSA